jgi:TonB family protein
MITYFFTKPAIQKAERERVAAVQVLERLASDPAVSASLAAAGMALSPGDSGLIAVSALPTHTIELEGLFGATLMGPISDRPILHSVTPVYPDWAKREGIEASVSLYFVVQPDGKVKPNVLVQKTGGFEDFDESARTALKAWQFKPLAGPQTMEQWGTVTFHFRLQGH